MFDTLYNFLAQGGILMIPILTASVIALTFFLERLIYLRRSKINPKKLSKDLYRLISEGKCSEALALAEHNDQYPLSRLMVPVLQNWSRSKSSLKELLEELGKREVMAMERYIGVIGVIATISPLMGLLGTVSGMITVFQQFIYSQSDPAFMSGGISKALITTASGLVVAIPALIASRYLFSRVDDLRLDLEHDLYRYLELKDES